MTTELHNDTLEWAAQWIEGSLKGEPDQRVREFGKNMAMTLRAARVDAPTVDEDMRELALTIIDLVRNINHKTLPLSEAQEMIARRIVDYSATAATAAPQNGYEQALTTKWDETNARRHALIEVKQSRTLSNDEASELRELQWLAGIKRALHTGPGPEIAAPAEQSELVEKFRVAIIDYCRQRQPTLRTPKETADTIITEVLNG